jgi:Protein of unknown function (DUF2817)
MPDPLDFYSADYDEARRRFRRAAERIKWSPGSQRVPEGSDESPTPLSIDWAAHGPDNPDRTLIISSGLHGVEGFFGSAVQLAALQTIFSDRAASPRGLRVVFVHALNPYGFANRRRVDERNIDPNRNFKLPHEAYAGCSDHYRRLNHWLNPESAPTNIDLFRWQACVAILRFGLPALKQAIAGGQYEFPRGLFFGGREPSSVSLSFQKLWPEWTRNAARVLHLDVHTGLGPSEKYKLLLDSVIDDDELQWLAASFGQENVETCDVTGVAYQAGGGLGRWCRESYMSGQYLCLCAEFGTYGPLTVLGALRAENRAQHFAARSSPRFTRAKTRLLNAFCPRSQAWRISALRNALSLIDRAWKVLSDMS